MAETPRINVTNCNAFTIREVQHDGYTWVEISVDSLVLTLFHTKKGTLPKCTWIPLPSPEEEAFSLLHEKLSPTFE